MGHSGAGENWFVKKTRSKKSRDTDTIFASVVDTGGKFATGVNDTGGKFATGVNDAGGKLPPVSTPPAANLPPVSLTPVANNGNNVRLHTP